MSKKGKKQRTRAVLLSECVLIWIVANLVLYSQGGLSQETRHMDTLLTNINYGLALYGHYVCMYVCLQQSSLQPQSPVYSTTSLVANKVKCLVCVQLGNVYYWVMVVMVLVMVVFGNGRFSLLVDLCCWSICVVGRFAICSSCGLFAFELLVCFLYCVV